MNEFEILHSRSLAESSAWNMFVNKIVRDFSCYIKRIKVKIIKKIVSFYYFKGLVENSEEKKGFIDFVFEYV